MQGIFHNSQEVALNFARAFAAVVAPEPVLPLSIYNLPLCERERINSGPPSPQPHQIEVVVIADAPKPTSAADSAKAPRVGYPLQRENGVTRYQQQLRPSVSQYP
jgi:hypothetical protein